MTITSSTLEYFADRVFRQLLPLYPVFFAGDGRAGAFYYLWQKFQYEPRVHACMLPFLAAVFERSGHVHLLQNNGDLFHPRHQRVTRRAIEALRILERGAAVVLVNEPAELTAMSSVGEELRNSARHDATVFNVNRLHDPTVYGPRAVQDRPYLFCHTARLIPEKQHELLLDGLLLRANLFADYKPLGIVLSSGCDDADVYGRALLDRLNRAAIEFRRGLSAAEVNLLLNQSRMGLTLSQAEGGVMSVGEYLLAGLPVVTIRNARGGKNLYLNASNAEFCDSSPEGLIEAINRAASRRFDHATIRDEFARQCLPQSFEDLKKIARKAAEKHGLRLGADNPQAVDKLIRFASLKDCGFDRKLVSDACKSVLRNWGWLMVRPCVDPDGPIRVFLENASLDQRFEPRCVVDSLDISRAGFAFFKSDSRPFVRIEMAGETHAEIPLGEQFTREFSLNGCQITVESQPAPPGAESA